MKIYLYIDGSDLDDVAEPVAAALTQWIGEANDKITLVNHRADETTVKPYQQPAWDLGINLTIKSKVELKEPLAFLYGIAKQYKQDFVVGIFDPQTDQREDVCYFGNEEGRPDLYEIANYLDL
jgi:hypothetical protein